MELTDTQKEAIKKIKLTTAQQQGLIKWLVDGIESVTLTDEVKQQLIKIDPTFKNTFDDMEQLKKEVASALFVESYKPKDSKKILYSHDKITKQLPVEPHPQILLNKKTGKSSAIVCMDLLDEKGEFISEPLNYLDMAVLQAVYSLIEDGNNRFTGAQIYRKMRGGARVNPTKEALDEIDKIMLKLKATMLNIECIDSDGKLSKEAIKIIGDKKRRDNLLAFESYGIIVNGQEGWGYEMLGRQDETGEVNYRPGFYRLIKKIGQIQKLPDNVLKVKKLDSKTNKYKSVGMTSERIVITKYLLDFVLTFNHSNGNITAKRTYDQIINSCKINQSKDTNPRRKKIKTIEFIKIVLDHFKANGLITHYEEYGNGRGIEIRTNKKS